MWVILWIKDVAWSHKQPQTESKDVDGLDPPMRNFWGFTPLTHLAATQFSQQARTDGKLTQAGVNELLTIP